MQTHGSKYDATGILYIVLTLLGWASVLLFLKHLTPYIDGWTANGWRYGLSALMWLPLLVVTTLRGRLPDGLWRRAIVPSVVNCAGQVCFALIPYYIGPGLAGFLLRVALVSSTCGALILFADERLLIRSPRFWIGLFLVVLSAAGTIVFSAAPVEGATATGIVLGLIAGTVFGLYGVSVRHYMRDIPAATSFAVISLYTAAGMVALMLLFGETGGTAVFRLSAFNWMILVVSAVVGIALGHVFYYASIARLGVAVSGAIVQLAPFFCAAASVAIFGEVLTKGQWISGFVMLFGGFILLDAERRRRHVGTTDEML